MLKPAAANAAVVAAAAVAVTPNCATNKQVLLSRGCATTRDCAAPPPPGVRPRDDFGWVRRRQILLLRMRPGRNVCQRTSLIRRPLRRKVHLYSRAIAVVPSVCCAALTAHYCCRRPRTYLYPSSRTLVGAGTAGKDCPQTRLQLVEEKPAIGPFQVAFKACQKKCLDYCTFFIKQARLWVTNCFRAYLAYRSPSTRKGSSLLLQSAGTKWR